MVSSPSLMVSPRLNRARGSFTSTSLNSSGKSKGLWVSQKAAASSSFLNLGSLSFSSVTGSPLARAVITSFDLGHLSGRGQAVHSLTFGEEDHQQIPAGFRLTIHGVALVPAS